MISKWLKLAFAAFLSFFLFACSEESPQATPVTAPKKVTPKANPATPAAKENAKETERKYAYDPLGRRDPFTPLVVSRPTLISTEPQTPLQSFELGQLRLVAIIIGKGPASAMVMAPDGKGYILKKGIRVGKNNGIVTGINPQAVLVEEKYMDFSGEIMVKTQEIQLPKREGA